MCLADMWQKISDYLAQLTGIDEVIVGFLYVPLILPFVTGLLMLILLRKDKLSLLAALFTLKPVIAYPIWWRLAILLTVDPPEGMSAPISSFLSILPAILLTAIIVFLFRSLQTGVVVMGLAGRRCAALDEHVPFLRFSI